MKFTDQEQQAFELGRRMSNANFSLQDNPYTHLHPHLAVRWQNGFFASHVLQNLSAALERGTLSRKRPHVHLVTVA